MKTPNEIIKAALEIYLTNFNDIKQDFAGHAYFESCLRAVLFVEDCNIRKELTKIQFKDIGMNMKIEEKKIG